MKIKTNSLEPGAPKDPADSVLFEIYQAFATAEETALIRQRYAAGIAWGEMKQILFEYLDAHLSGARERYEEIMVDGPLIEKTLQQGAEKTREKSRAFLHELKAAVGIKAIS